MIYKICMMYRPIAVRLFQLMHYPKFRKTSAFNENMYHTDGTFADTLDENTAVKALTNMEFVFAENISEAEVEDYINSPHLFSEFYDGAQLFDYRLSNFDTSISSNVLVGRSPFIFQKIPLQKYYSTKNNTTKIHITGKQVVGA